MSGCYPNSCNTGSCYNPCGSSCYPNTSYLCAPPQPCRQTVFKPGNCNSNGVSVNVSGTHFGTPADGSCTDYTSIEINGSGFSLVSICIGTSSSTGAGSWNTAVAGIICSCPNNFTTTIFINKTVGAELAGGVSLIQAVGCINWCVCGCNVCGNGSITGITGNADDTQTTFTGTVQISGTACSACGTRTICINSLTITA